MTTVMIVDDSEIVLELTSHALRGAGFKVAALSSPLGLTAAIYKERPDVLLVDIDMPALSGIAVTQLVKRNARFSATRVILHSSRSEDEISDALASSGADGFLQKQPNPDDVVSELRRLLDS